MARKFPHQQEPEDDDEDFEDEGEDEDAEDVEEDDVEEEDQDPDSELSDEDEEPAPLQGQELNRELFRSAVASIREVVPAWKQQVDLLLGHPVEFAADFDSLEGRYDLVQPFVHLAIAGALEAITKVRFDPKFGAALMGVNGILIRPGSPDEASCAVDLREQSLTIRVALTGERPPTEAIADGIRAAVGPSAPVLGIDDPFSPPPQEPYERADRDMASLERAMREAGLWPRDKPPGPVEVKGAFGADNMPFTQWLAWVMIPRVRQIVADRGKFPRSSAVGHYASVRGLQGVDNAGKIIEILTAFDEYLASLLPLE